MHTYSTYNDEQLLSLMKENNEAAFDVIYHRYWKSLFTLAAFKLKDFYLAEEIVHDIFIDLWNRRCQIEISVSLSSYLSAATKYRIINARIKQQKLHDRERRTSQMDDGLISNLPTNEQDFNDYLKKVISTLPEKSQLIFQLSKQQGFCHQEIAVHLKISEKTVEYHLSKVMKSLRASISNFFFIEVIFKFLQ